MKQVYKMIGFYLNEETISWRTTRKDSRGSGAVRICDLQGQVLIDKPIHNQEADINLSLPAGVYVVKILGLDLNYNEVLVITH